MSALPYTLTESAAVCIGLVVLQADETIERDFRRLIPPEVELLVTRIPSAPEVTCATLGAMQAHLTAAVRLFPASIRFAAVGYGCTSGAAQIGTARVAELVGAGIATGAVTEPVLALLTACRALGIRRLGLLSPYVAQVSARLREVLAEAGLATPAFATFAEAEEARVARIDARSIAAAARMIGGAAAIDGLFLSCTNLRTLDVIDSLETELGIPVLSSNQVLAWHLLGLAGMAAPPAGPGRLFAGTAIRGRAVPG